MFSRKGTGGGGPTSSKLVMKSKGWKADKYEFQVTVRSLYNLLPGTKRTQLLIKRGSKVAKTAIVDASKGECDFNDEVLTISTSLFVNPRTGEYESKPMLITVKEIMSPTKTRVYAESKNRSDEFLPPTREGNHEDGPFKNRERREDGATDARAIFGASDTGGGRGGVFGNFERRVDREFERF